MKTDPLITLGTARSTAAVLVWQLERLAEAGHRVDTLLNKAIFTVEVLTQLEKGAERAIPASLTPCGIRDTLNAANAAAYLSFPKDDAAALRHQDKLTL